MSEPRACPNCGAPAPARYCGECGQRQGERLVSLRRLVGDVVEDHLSLSSALPRTLGNLLVRPGHLTAEYVAGRIARYVAPFRLYLLASLAFFLTMAWTADLDRLAGTMDIGAEDAAGGAPTEDEGAALRPEDGEPAAGQVAGAGALREHAAARESGEAGATEAGATEAGGTEAAGTKASGTEASAGAPDPVSGGAPDSARGAAKDPPPDGAEQDGGWDISISFSDTTRVPGWAKPLARYLARQEQRLEAMEPEALTAAMLAGFQRNAPKAAFLLLPIFALLLKLLYIRRRRTYVEHFIFSLHFHAFAFLAATVMLAVRRDLVAGIVSLLILIYLLWAMRRVYGQSWMRTGLKYILLVGTYWVVLISVLAFGVVLTTLVI